MARKRPQARASLSHRPPAFAAPTSQFVAIAAGLVAIVAIIYFQARHFGFVPIDDHLYVIDNPHLVGGLTWSNVSWAFTSQWAGYWIPLVWLSYMFDVTCFGAGPGMMHVTNVALHAVNAVLVFVWLRRATGSMWRSAFVAALFAVHPLHVESVAWITERKDVLSTFFLLLSLIAYGRYVRERSTMRYLTLCGLFIAGLLTKPMLVTLPFMLLLCDIWPLGRVTFVFAGADARTRWRGLIVEKLPLAAIAAVASVIVFITQSKNAMLGSAVFAPGLRVENAFVSFVVYLRQTLWPSALTVNYPYPSAIPMWQVAGAFVLLARASVAIIRSAATRPYLVVGWLWYLGTLVPVIGFIQVGLQPMADRFTYVPLIGIFVIIVWGATELAARLGDRGAVAATIGAVAIAGLSGVCFQQVSYWRDGVTLWTHAVDVTPPADAAQAQFDLGSALLEEDRAADAIPHLSEAIRVKPDYAGAHGMLGVALGKISHTAEAKTEYESALRLDDAIPEVQNNLGAILGSEGQLDEAVPHFEAAVRLKPDFESARVNLGVALARLGRKDDAVRELTAALRLNPANTQAQHVLESLTKR